MVSPAFVADCLETLEEIGMGGRDIFLNAGGSEYRLLSCLNDDPAWVKVVVDWISAWESSFCRPMRKQEGSV